MTTGLRLSIAPDAHAVSVVDAFHAMVTDRPYRKARTFAYAKSQLRKYSGTQFDPNVVEVFLREMGKEFGLSAFFEDQERVKKAS